MNRNLLITVFRLQKVIQGDQSGISKSVGWNPQHPTLMDEDKYAHNSFVYCELACANQHFIDAIMAATDSATLQTIWEQMQQTGFLSYKVNIHDIDKHIDDWQALSLEDQKRFLMECLDVNLLYVPYSDIDDATYRISAQDKKLNHQFYSQK